MATKITEWRPHVCPCVIQYSWDSESSEATRVHTVVSHVHCGQDHPHAKVGEVLETSEFINDYKSRETARQAALVKE